MDPKRESIDEVIRTVFSDAWPIPVGVREAAGVHIKPSRKAFAIPIKVRKSEPEPCK